MQSAQRKNGVSSGSGAAVERLQRGGGDSLQDRGKLAGRVPQGEKSTKRPMRGGVRKERRSPHTPLREKRAIYI